MAKYILGDIFKGNFPVSQFYGQRPEYYKQFNLAGHEGVDFATPIGTPILAPFDGVVIRDNDDPKQGAYGDTLVLWDSKQKCAVWFCHLLKDTFSVGDKVKKGQVLGETGNSGNTSGPHLHFNIVETDDKGNRLNKDNGYQGFLNALDPNLVEWKLGEDLPQATDPLIEVSRLQNDLLEANKAKDKIYNDFQEELHKSSLLQDKIIVSDKQHVKDLEEIKRLNEIISNTATADRDAVSEQLTAQHELDFYKPIVENIAKKLNVEPTKRPLLQFDIEKAIEEVKKPQDDVVKNYLKNLEEAYKNLPRLKKDGIINWLYLGINLLKNKFKK